MQSVIPIPDSFARRPCNWSRIGAVHGLRGRAEFPSGGGPLPTSAWRYRPPDFTSELPCSGWASPQPEPPSPFGVRVFTARERRHLGVTGLNLICALEWSGALDARLREQVLERAVATPSSAISADSLKSVVLEVLSGAGRGSVERALLTWTQTADVSHVH